MPYSSTEGKQFVKDWFSHRGLKFIVDVGPGAGAWRDVFGGNAHWTAVEIWGPYIEYFGLREKYNDVIIADALYLDWDAIGYPDLVIFGDVIEHMHFDDACTVLDNAMRRSTYAVVSVPIIHYPQGTEMGNPFEAHLTHYTKDSIRALLDTYNILAYDEGNTVGTYIIGPK